MNHRFAIWTLVAALLLPAPAWAQTVVRLLHIEEDRAKVARELAAALAAGNITPPEAARALQEEWQLQLQTEDQP